MLAVCVGAVLAALWVYSRPEAEEAPVPDLMPLLVPRDALYAQACALVALVESTHGNGEARRHQVYAALLKRFPERTKRDVALAIEAAVRG
jgi:hypothetical protein